MKYVLVTGGVLSGLGKGVIASSTGRLLRSHGFRVTSIKIDPYINIDAGTMSPFEHGEVFILDDGGEADLDLGNYERFVDLSLQKDNNITTGKIYKSVIEKERRGEYLGKTVQVVPHICDEIQDWIARVASISTDGSGEPPDICVIELGGTIGDIESMPFVEAMRQFQFRVGKENFCLMHVSLVPVIGVVGEQKTKPTQQTVRELRALGLSPDMILCRSSNELSPETKQKISLFCHVPPEVRIIHFSIVQSASAIIESRSVRQSSEDLTSPSTDVDFTKWVSIADKMDRLKAEGKKVRIAVVGKYTGLQDSYISIIRALEHASFFVDRLLVVDWIEATDLENKAEAKHEQSWKLLREADGILVPGGFGDRGVEGKIIAAKYAREHKKPFLGICLGLQIAVIEHAKNLLGWADATSEEFNSGADKSYRNVIMYMPEISKTHMGGTMRLGARRTVFKDEDSLTYKLYNKLMPNNPDPKSIMERHRHRYEVNPAFVPELTTTGLHFVGQDETGARQEIVERKDHPYYVAVQYHPEMKSRPHNPSPPFVGLLLAASGQLTEFLTGI